MKKLYNRVKHAVQQDSSIVVERSKVSEYTGATTKYLQTLGLTKSDLLRLERAGLAIRGYLPKNIRQELDGTSKHDGYERRWLLIKDAIENENN